MGHKEASLSNMGFTALTSLLEAGTLPTIQMIVQTKISFGLILYKHTTDEVVSQDTEHFISIPTSPQEPQVTTDTQSAGAPAQVYNDFMTFEVGRKNPALLPARHYKSSGLRSKLLCEADAAVRYIPYLQARSNSYIWILPEKKT